MSGKSIDFTSKQLRGFYFCIAVLFLFLYNFKGYFQFIVFTKCWLYCSIVQYIHEPVLHLIVCTSCFPTPILPAPASNHQFVLYICEPASFLFYALFCCIFQIPHTSDIIQCLFFFDLFYLAQCPPSPAMLMAKFFFFLMAEQYSLVNIYFYIYIYIKYMLLFIC